MTHSDTTQVRVYRKSSVNKNFQEFNGFFLICLHFPPHKFKALRSTSSPPENLNQTKCLSNADSVTKSHTTNILQLNRHHCVWTCMKANLLRNTTGTIPYPVLWSPLFRSPSPTTVSSHPHGHFVLSSSEMILFYHFLAEFFIKKNIFLIGCQDRAVW